MNYLLYFSRSNNPKNKKIMNTTENNKLIAEFMGSEKPEFARINGALINIENCAYQYSWDWLIPVVEKIEGMNWSTEMRYTSGIGHNFFFISGGAELHRLRSSDTKIKATYRAVVEFIKWYNQQK